MIGIWKKATSRLGRLVRPRRAAPAPTRTTAQPTPTRTAAQPTPTRTAAQPTPARAAARPAPARTAAQPTPARTRTHPPTTGPRGVAAGGRRLVYAPQLDGQADPGEIVWTWVAYEDDPRQGKDRPVLVIGRRGGTLLGLMLSSRQERDGQRHWFALGPGAWDRQSRPSWIRLDRVLEVPEDGIRREGAVLDRARFEAVARALRAGYGWA